jgi:hypothetical protein
LNFAKKKNSKFKIQKLGDFGGFSIVKVRKFLFSENHHISILGFFQCVAKNIEG